MPASAPHAILELRPAKDDMKNGMVNGLGKDLRASLRMFRRYPGVTALALISLALGIIGGEAHCGYGRAILQVVGTMACAVSTLETRCQPQPVFSSSKGSFSVSLPKEEM